MTARALIIAILTLASVATDAAPRVSVKVDSRDIYTGVAFELQVIAEGFEQDPQPTVDDFLIPAASVQFTGVTPQVRQALMNVNGRHSVQVQVHVFRYRVVVNREGQNQIPAITVRQSSATASSRPGRFRARPIASTRDMALDVSLPDRPLWIGETFEVAVDLYLRKDPNSPSFTIPLFAQPETFAVSKPRVGTDDKTFEFTAGDQTISLPYETKDGVAYEGLTYTRLRFRARITPLKAGRFELEPSTVVATLPSGTGRDSFGFRTTRRRMFRSASRPRSLEVKAVPATGKPATYAGAVGSQFSLDVQASRTVVRVGDPIELTAVVRGTGLLEGLPLPDFRGAGGLPEDKFEIADAATTGELSEDRRAKTFRITVRLRSTKARSIPALTFPYFDPKTGNYKLAKSQPIALNVAGSSLVGAEQVIAAGSTRPTTATESQAPPMMAELALSAPGATLRRASQITATHPLVIALYVIPVLLLLGISWRRRTGEQRSKDSDTRKARRRALDAIKRARTLPARDATGDVVASLRDLARKMGHKPSSPVIADLETAGYGPNAARDPVDGATLDRALELTKTWANAKSPGATAARALLILAMSALPSTARASVDDARTAYQAALEADGPRARMAAFAQAEHLFAAEVARTPDRPELLADWGNAALGARNFGPAVLAYRRALALDPGLHRARASLEWTRESASPHMPRRSDTGALDSLFFWHNAWSVAARHLAAAAAFCIGIIMLIPFGRRTSPWLRRGAVLPLLVCGALWVSIILAPSPSTAVVVMRESVLRTADSRGAPPTSATPIPAGAEGTLIERRGEFVRVSFEDGTEGWMAQSAIATVGRPSS